MKTAQQYEDEIIALGEKIRDLTNERGALIAEYSIVFPWEYTISKKVV